MRPTIVLATVLLDFEGRMLLGRRRDSDLYGPPGGKLDEDELLKAGAARELREETGLRVLAHDLVELGFCERTDKHQIVFWYWAAMFRGSPQNLEPQKCRGWEYADVPGDELCIPGLRIFKRRLMGVLHNVSGIKPRVAA